MIKKLIALMMSISLGACIFTGCKDDNNEQDEKTLVNDAVAGYESTLFDTSYVHEINVEISEEDWEDLLSNPTDKTKYTANITIDGEEITNVSFATKGNTSLSQVASTDSDRYSFKINFGKYVEGQSYNGLDKLNLNNIMSDATYMKDYLSYEIMRQAGVAAPLTSYVQLSINGQVHGLYLAIEDVDESFMERNYSREHLT